MKLVRAFFPKIRALFFKFWKRAGRPSRPSVWSSLRKCLYSYLMSFKKVNDQELLLIIMRFRSSRLKMFFKLGFLKYFAVFKGKTQCLQACNFIKKWLQHRHFPMNIAKSLRTIFFTEHLQWLSLAFWNC